MYLYGGEIKKDGRKLTINQWAEEDRPREKMMLHGVGTLSDAELLAILIGSGNTEDSAVELMRKVLSDYHNSLNELGKTTVDELCHYKGIGPAKAITILAASELGKRRKEEEGKNVRSFSAPVMFINILSVDV